MFRPNSSMVFPFGKDNNHANISVIKVMINAIMLCMYHW